jgi:hypothetical protein
MHLRLTDLLDRLNVGNCILYSLLLILSVLISLRAEGVINWSYGAVFLPLWLWNVLVVAGAVPGVVVWIWKKRLRQQDPDNVYHFKALILSPLLQLPVFLTELLVAINLDTGAHLWRAIFTPLYILPLLYILPCIWGVYRKRSVDLEVLGIFSLLQVIFLAIRLDGVVQWKWAIVFIPTYLLLLAFWCCVGVFSTYLLLHHLLHPTATPQELQAERVADILRVTCSIGVGVCATIFVALLASQLDDRISAPYPAIFVPLFIMFLFLLVSTVSRLPANPWWFGVHRNFSTFALDVCPILREYANISITSEDNASQNSNPDVEQARSKVKKKHKQVSSQCASSEQFPLEDIFTPD